VKFKTSPSVPIGERAFQYSAESMDDPPPPKRLKCEEITDLGSMKAQILELRNTIFSPNDQSPVSFPLLDIRVYDRGAQAYDLDGMLQVDMISLSEIRERMVALKESTKDKTNGGKTKEPYLMRNWTEQVGESVLKGLSRETPTNIILREAFFLLEEMIGKGKLLHKMIRSYAHIMNSMRKGEKGGFLGGVATIVTITEDTVWFFFVGKLVEEANRMAKEASTGTCEWNHTRQDKIDEMTRRIGCQFSLPLCLLMIT
jgi:hypothetical protein